MNNEKFIIHNHSKRYKDYELFNYISYIMKKGLLSNNNTEYCYCSVWEHENFELVIEFNKTKNNYRIDIFEINKGRIND